MKNRYNTGVYIDHWRKITGYEKGTLEPGWYCWVFVADDTDFTGWMDQYCPTADYIFRFNSGNPMYTVNITDENEALLFQLQWVK